MSKVTIELPLRIKIGRKFYALNLNVYRNTHFQLLNKMKVEFSSLIEPELTKLPKFAWVTLRYDLYPGSKRLCDVSNICSIVDKFFCDALVRAGKLEDDNYQFIPTISYNMGYINHDNPHVTVTIEGEIENADHPDRK